MSKPNAGEQPAPVDPVDFDLAAWVDGAVVATDRIEVSSRAGLRATVDDLKKQIDAASSSTTRAAARRAEVKALEEQLAEATEALAGSWVEVEFRTPTPGERSRAFKGIGEDDAEGKTAALLAIVGRLRPIGAEDWTTLEADGWRRIFDVIGSGQFDALSVKVATLAFTRGVTPDFSQRASSYLETRRSSTS